MCLLQVSSREPVVLGTRHIVCQIWVLMRISIILPSEGHELDPSDSGTQVLLGKSFRNLWYAPAGHEPDSSAADDRVPPKFPRY